MKFLTGEKVRSEKLYYVGFCPELNKYILACTIPWIVWYDRYYEISKEEYESFGSEALDNLAEELYKQGITSKKFLFSDKIEENNPAQRGIRDKLWT